MTDTTHEFRAEDISPQSTQPIEARLCEECSQPRSAAIHSVSTPAETQPCKQCGETELHLAACYLNRSIDGSRRTPVRQSHRRAASDTPPAEQPYTTITIGNGKIDPSLPTHCDHGVSLDDPCEACPATEATAAPERVWHSGALQIAMQAASWFDRKDLTLPEREMRVSEIISDFAESLRQAEVSRLREALQDAQMAIRVIPQDALGRDPQEGHYYRDELLAKIAAAIEGKE